MNLVSNGVRYGYAGFPIDLALEPADDTLVLTVANAGDGIPAGELSSIFGRFQRSRSAATASQVGLGLGLYIVQGLVEAHGGRIEVESVPREQTRFRIVLPCAGPPADDPKR